MDGRAPRGRFAPTPSGALHLGSARTALCAYLSARHRDGTFALRVEDLDALRTPPGATRAMLEDLRWLGIDWDEGPDVGGPAGPYVQSERRALYDAALELLRARGAVYPCACSRKEIEQAATAPHGAEPVYPGTCRDRDAGEVAALARARGRGVAWRFRVDPGTVTFVDEVHGYETQDVAREVGDFVVYRADGVPAYQLAVVVDDVAMEVTEVVRGDDLLASTPRQLLVYGALGAATVLRFAHVPLVLGDDGARLAKRHGSISLASLRDSGLRPVALVHALAVSLGLATATERPPTLAELVRRYDPRALPREPVHLAALREVMAASG